MVSSQERITLLTFYPVCIRALYGERKAFITGGRMRISSLCLSVMLFVVLICMVTEMRAQCVQVPEIPAQIPDIAMATWHSGPLGNKPYYNGPIIYYNPNVAHQISYPLNLFFKMHEYGHVCLNHIPSIFLPMHPYERSWMSIELEYAADRYATTEWWFHRSTPQPVCEAYLWFRQQINQPELLPLHPPGVARAHNIRMAVQSSGADFLSVCQGYGYPVN